MQRHTEEANAKIEGSKEKKQLAQQGWREGFLRELKSSRNSENKYAFARLIRGRGNSRQKFGGRGKPRHAQ